ncbi:hypothetical protein ACHQM5_026551 [Ranunculus cassubicifolius]
MLRVCTEENMIRFWTGGPYKIKDQFFRFTKWTTDHFNPDTQKSSRALLWVKFPQLKQQYWEYETLMTLGKALGTPIGVDQHTLKRDFGFFFCNGFGRY